MATDSQAALIRRIKSRLRQLAEVPSFDPSEPCLQSQPTLEEVVAGFDPSSPQLGCRKCRGRLLAGIRSHVCIYCGAQQRNDVFPPSMSFTSTFAYREFLRSLQLDGSDTELSAKMWKKGSCVIVFVYTALSGNCPFICTLH